MSIGIILAIVAYTLIVSGITALIFLRKFDKIRFEHFDKVVGSLHIEPGEADEQPMIFLELYKDTGDISKREFVHLSVETKSYVTQK